MNAGQSSLRGVLVAFASYAVFAFSDASIKILHGSLPAYQVAFIGAVFGFSAIPFLKTGDDTWLDMVRTTNRPLWMLRFVCGAVGAICSVIAFTKLPMAEAFALLFLLPSFVTILSVVFLKEDVRWQRWTAVIIGFLGVLVVLRPGFRELSIGHLCAAIGGMSVQMIWAIAFGYLIFNDAIDLPMAVGIVLIIFSGLLTLARERKRGTPLPAAVTPANNLAAVATAADPSEIDRNA